MATVQGVATITGIIPQFIVDDLEVAMAYYRDRLGFDVDFIYDDFYASVSRNGFAIHLKKAPKLEGERTYKKAHEHLDAFVRVSGVRELFGELQSKGAAVIRPLTEQPWSCIEFYVEDPDGNILCFSELIT